MTTTWDGLAVTEQGVGPAVLWLHGYTMRAEVWRAVWRRLPHWRHVGLDLPWHGHSRPLRPDEELAALADTVVAAARAAGIRHLVALSLGTVLATEMASRHPKAFASLMLSAPALAGMPHEPAVRRRYADLAILHRRSGAGPHMTALWMASPPAIFAGVAARPAVDAALRALIDRHCWKELADGGMQRLLRRPQSPGMLARVKAPLLVLIGDGDLLSHRACARSIVAAVPSASLHVLGGAGHLAVLEEPAAAAAVIGAHLIAADGRRDG